MSPNETRKRILYLSLAVAAAAMTELGVQIQKGALPLPPEWAWVGPVAVAGIVALTAKLDKIRSAE